MSQDITLTKDQAALIPQYVEITNLIAKKAVALEKSGAVKTAADDQTIKTAAAELANEMVQSKGIKEAQQNEAETLLGTHTGALSVLKNALSKIATLKEELTKKEAEVGQAVPSDFGSRQGAKAAYDSLNDGYVGRKTTMTKASDHALISGLGLEGMIGTNQS